MVPTLRFYLLLALGGLLAMGLAQGFGQGIALGGLGLYDVVLITFGLIDARQARKQRIQVQRLPFGPLSIGRDNVIHLSLTSQGQAARVWIRDAYPSQFIVSQHTLRAALQPRSQQILSYSLQPNQRGQYPWGQIQVRQLGPWGLSWQDWRIPATTSVAVHPDLMALKSLSIRLTLESSGNLRQARRLGLGTEFTELRDYQQGDDLRYVDWKATARRARPLVRVLEPDREQTVMILLDRGRLMTAQVAGLQRFDWGLNTALALALAALHRGDRVGLGVFDQQIAAWLPPERGLARLSLMLDTVSPLQPVLQEPDYVGAISRLVSQQTRRALVVVITDLIDETASAELLAALVRLMPRYLPFCVTLRDPQVDQLAEMPIQTISQAYRQAVARHLLEQRRVALAKLKQRGGLVLDAPASQVSQQLVDQYLRLKAKTLL
ncbi:DUF58 domain-containing protein [Synechocystis sp. LKSZ1]|uniref:DUF58 domain-containing protein n=1 Tax=Synechocystis sp. LKSZ1 TaxID=3144951 RepID=UPI00336BFC66